MPGAVAKSLSPSSHRYYLWQDDRFDKRCECVRCSDLSAADQLVHMTDDIMRGLKRSDNRAKLAYLIYSEKHERPTIPLPEGAFPEFAPFKRNHEVPLCGGADEKNAAFARELCELAKMFNMTEMHILEYFLDVSMFCNYKRERADRVNLNPHRVKADVDFYASFGVRFITTFAAYMDEQYLEKFGYDAVKQYAEILHSAR